MFQAKIFELPSGGSEFWRLEARFLSRVYKYGPVPECYPELGPCWLWMGWKYHSNGYGGFYLKGCGNVGAHRVSWSLFNRRKIPTGKQVLHKCDNTRCVRPGHLFLGTSIDNTIDKMSKGRAKGPRLLGEQNPSHKLTEAKVREVFYLYAKGNISQEAIGERFGVTGFAIHAVLTGLTWTHLANTVTKGYKDEGYRPHS